MIFNRQTDGHFKNDHQFADFKPNFNATDLVNLVTVIRSGVDESTLHIQDADEYKLQHTNT